MPRPVAVRILVPMMLVLLAVAGAGCNPVHVNVPPLPGDTAFHSPNMGSVIDVETTSIEYVLKRWPVDGEYAIDLPHGTSDETYAEILAALPEGGHVASRRSGDLPTYRVVQVRVRRSTALVDIVVPQQPTEQLVTVTAVRDMMATPWYARSGRVWRIPVERALWMSAGSLQPADEPRDPDPETEYRPAPETEGPAAPESEPAPRELDQGPGWKELPPSESVREPTEADAEDALEEATDETSDETEK